MKFQDLTNQTINRLTFVSFIGRNELGQAKWLCRCVCGNTKEVLAHHVKSGNTQSCGHDRSERHMQHGGTGTPEYESFNACKKRCNPKFTSKYPRHAGRGIEFRFKNFEEFLAELGPKPEPKADYTCDRWPNNDGHYEVGNVRWATKEQQAGNRRCEHCDRRNDVLDLSKALGGTR
jgi:hypothetical protein